MKRMVGRLTSTTLKRKITPQTRGIVVINPNNPTGALYGKETLQRIVDLARRHNLVIFADEIYDKLLMGDHPLIPLASLAGDVTMVTFGGLSKSYLAPGWRIGWGIVERRSGLFKALCRRHQ